MKIYRRDNLKNECNGNGTTESSSAAELAARERLGGLPFYSPRKVQHCGRCSNSNVRFAVLAATPTHFLLIRTLHTHRIYNFCTSLFYLEITVCALAFITLFSFLHF